MGCEKEVVEKKVIRPVRVVKLGNTDGLSKRSFPGRAEATREVNLGFEVGGTLVDLKVKKGDVVKKGQLLGWLDARTFQNELNAATAELNRAKAHRDRIARAVKTGAVAKQELTNAEAQLEVAGAEVKIKSKNLGDTKLLAPFDGGISVTYVDSYQRLQPKQEVLRLLDDSKIKFTVAIPENLISLVSYVTRAEIRFDAFPDRAIQARIEEIGSEASEATRTYPVTLIMDQPEDIKILPGMAGKVSGNVELPREFKSKGIEIPVAAIFEEGNKSYVWLVEETTMTVTRREVTPGQLTSYGIRVEGPLKVGDAIVTAGIHFLKEGEKVRFLEETATGTDS